MRNIIGGVALAFICTFAFADGVPFMTPAKALSANDPIYKNELMKEPDIVKLYPMVVNRSAFGANILLVTIDGKTHTFVGSMNPPSKGVWSGPANLKEPEPRSWVGFEGRDEHRNMLSLATGADTNLMSVGMELDGRRFELVRNVLVERDYERRTPAQKMQTVKPPSFPAPVSGAHP